MKLKPFVAAVALPLFCMGAFASTSSFDQQSHSSRLILMGLGMMVVIVWRRLKSADA